MIAITDEVNFVCFVVAQSLTNLRGHQVMFFNADQNVGKSLKYILAKFKVSTSSRFRDTAFQSYQFLSYFSVAFFPVL